MKVNDISTTKTTIQREIRENKVVGKRQIAEESTNAVRDQVELSSSYFIDRARAEATKMREIREERVRELQERIARGSYQVSNRELARAMISSLLAEIF